MKWLVTVAYNKNRFCLKPFATQAAAMQEAQAQREERDGWKMRKGAPQRFGPRATVQVWHLSKEI